MCWLCDGIGVHTNCADNKKWECEDCRPKEVEQEGEEYVAPEGETERVGRNQELVLRRTRLLSKIILTLRVKKRNYFNK